jgi:transcriptional regulator with XRE-family HTH domain
MDAVGYNNLSCNPTLCWIMMPQMDARNQRDKRSKGLELERRAEALGVSESHLSRVISGKRDSASLIARFTKLLESEKSKPSTPKNIP